MKRKIKIHYIVIIVIIFSLHILSSCNAREDISKQIPPSKKQPIATETPAQQTTTLQTPVPQMSTPQITSPPELLKSPTKPGIVIEVNGKELSRQSLDQEVKKTMEMMKSRIPSEKKKEYELVLKKRIVEGFVSQTLLAEEIERKKVNVTNQEVTDEINKIKGTLPAGVTMEDFLKKNNINPNKMKEDIRFAIQINKLVSSSVKDKVKPTEKEIEQFYQKNKDKFKRPDTIHARHILIAKAATDDEKIKAEKKAKAEALRKQLIEGADFAQLATQNSDCPSKKNGGDLGVFAKGQMVKPFEDAALSQKIKEIGPVVETDFGYHIIQVLERKPTQTMDLDNTVRGQIASFLEQQKLQEAFANILRSLKDKATIRVHEKI